MGVDAALLAAKAFEELVELFLLFLGEDRECGSETVAEIVTRGGYKTLGSFWTCRVLCVRLIG